MENQYRLVWSVYGRKYALWVEANSLDAMEWVYSGLMTATVGRACVSNIKLLTWSNIKAEYEEIRIPHSWVA